MDKYIQQSSKPVTFCGCMLYTSLHLPHLLYPTAINFHEDDNKEMLDVFSFIDSHPATQEQLQSLFAEVEDPERRLEKAWQEDKSTLLKRAQFLKDQQQCSKFSGQQLLLSYFGACVTM